MISDIAINNEKENVRFETSKVFMISAAHAVHDTYTGSLPALLPVLIEKFSLTHTAAGFLSVIVQLPSLLQPIVGHLADRKNLRNLIILTPAITGACMSMLSISPTYGFLLFLLIIAGISSASLHSIGPVLISSLSGNKLGRGMSFWMVGGELGRALGPIIVVSAIGYLTVAGLPWLMLGGILISLYIYFKLPYLTTQINQAGNQIPWKTGLRMMRSVMIPIGFIVFFRSMMMATLTIYLPTYLTSTGASLWMAGASLSILEAAGVVGAFLSGSLSDHFGRRKIMAVSFIFTPVFILFFIFAKGVFQIPLLLLMGFFGISTTPVIMAIVLENFPNNRSFANGVYMFFYFVLMAFATLLVGKISDLINLRFTFFLSAGLILCGLPVIRYLPKSNHHSPSP